VEGRNRSERIFYPDTPPLPTDNEFMLLPSPV
jgi:hypothetical protein